MKLKIIMIITIAIFLVLAIFIAFVPKTKITGKVASENCNFIRGDANTDRNVDITDAISTLNYLFAGGSSPQCGDAADANDDGRIDLTDPIYTLNFLFQGGPQPPAPSPEEGTDQTSDALSCFNLPDSVCSSTASLPTLGRMTGAGNCGDDFISQQQIETTDTYCCYGGISSTPCSQLITYSEISKNTETPFSNIKACSFNLNGEGCDTYDKYHFVSKSENQQVHPTSLTTPFGNVYITWEQAGGEVQAIYLCDLSISDKVENCDPEFVSEGENPVITLVDRGPYIIFEKNSNAGREIIAYNIQTNRPITILSLESDSPPGEYRLNPIAKHNYLLYRLKEQNAYSLYLCYLGTDLNCNPSLLSTAQIDLPQAGDISPTGGVLTAIKNDQNSYDIIYFDPFSSPITVQINSRLVESPKIISFRKQGIVKEDPFNHFAVWKEALPGSNKVFIKSIKESPSLYEFQTPGYSATGLFVSCENSDFQCLIGTNLIGPKKSNPSYRPDRESGNFVNEKPLCDVSYLPLLGDRNQEGGCLRRI